MKSSLLEQSKIVFFPLPEKKKKFTKLAFEPLNNTERQFLISVGDGCASLLAIIFALSLQPAQSFSVLPITFLVILWITLFYLYEMYDLKQASLMERTIASLGKSLLISPLIASLVFYVFSFLKISQLTFLLSVIFAFPLVLLWRYFYSLIFKMPFTDINAVIIGTGWSGITIAKELNNHKELGYNLVGFVGETENRDELIEGKPVLSSYKDLLSVCRKFNVQEIIVAISEEMPQETIKAIIACRNEGIRVFSMSTLYEKLFGKVPINYISYSWFFDMDDNDNKRFFEFGKRIFDIISSVIGLVIFLLFLPLIALLIKLESKGPIFYRQERVGRDGKTFNIYKLRTMIDKAEEKSGPVWTTSGDDNRITKIGRYLRLFRIDEIPQLINVLKGEMSLIGPRPERPFYVEKLKNEIPFYQKRLSVKPGITGWAQVKNGYTSSVEDTAEKLKYDLYYIKNCSAILDTKILLKTIKVVLTGKGAR